MNTTSRRHSQASDRSAYFSARSGSPCRMDLDESREPSLGPRRKKPRISARAGKRSLSSTPPASPSKRVRFSSPEISDHLQALTVTQLKDRMAALGLSFAGLVEKTELITRLRAFSGHFTENLPHNSRTPVTSATTTASTATTSGAASGATASSAASSAASGAASVAQTSAATAASRTYRKSKDDFSEICRIEKVVARGGTFREILDLGVSVSVHEISSVTKRLYRAVHPDKVPPGLKERASAVFDAVRKAEGEATKLAEKRLKVKPTAVAEVKFSVHTSKQVVTIKWRMAENSPGVARPDRFQLAAGTAGFRVEQGAVSSGCGDEGWYEFSMSTVSRKGNDRLFDSRVFYFYVMPVNEAGSGPEAKLLVSLKEDSLPSFAGLTGFIRRHNTF